MSSYKDHILARSHRNPCIDGLIKHLEDARVSRAPSTIVAIDYLPHSTKPPKSPYCRTVPEAELSRVLHDTSSVNGRILLVEDIQPRLVHLLGGALGLDPLFFAGHISTDAKDVEKGPASPSLALFPSQIAERGLLHLHYQQVVDLGSADDFKDCSYNLHTNSNIPRNVRRLPHLAGRQLGLARRCISAVVKNVGDSQSWTCLILCDSPINTLIGIDSSGQQRTYASRPLHRGFEDFFEPPPYDSAASPAGHDQTPPAERSTLDSLVRYFCNKPPPGFQAASPSILSLGYYPTRIALAEWNIYIRLVSRYFKYHEYTIQDNDTRLHDNDIADLQRWRRRTMQSQKKLTMLSTFIEYWLPEETEKRHWEQALKDIDYIRAELEQTHRSLEQVIPVVASMVQLLETRRSIMKATNVTKLTYTALIFVPLSWVTGLFSMAEGYSPGGDRFWVYFATALPVLGVALLGSAVEWSRAAAWLKGIIADMFKWQLADKKRKMQVGSV
ncbi:hypothetical protein QBC42DRAFT_329323 [Cladorrhinum samala]|uniref:Uncharacterized protein n=1 Tax=Cladorrhinum samala TaxID=585594 RepID=A0AAV9I227_9PEZI|nr:hypothetical protein QBC42DRAFT_329323 [Cladorrhinum samala]